MTYGELASRATGLWRSYCASQATFGNTLSQVALRYLCSDELASQAVQYVAEIQLQYEPYVTHGRLKTHLHYKIVRASNPGRMLADFQVGERFTDAEEQAQFWRDVAVYNEGVVTSCRCDLASVRLSGSVPASTG